MNWFTFFWQDLFLIWGMEVFTKPEDLSSKSCIVSCSAFRSLICFVYVGVLYVYVHMCIYACVCRCASYMHESVEDTATLGVFLCYLLPYFLALGRLLNLKLTSSAKLAGQWAPGIFLPLFPQLWNDRHVLLFPAFDVAAGGLSSGPQACRQSLCTLFPTPAHYDIFWAVVCKKCMSRCIILYLWLYSVVTAFYPTRLWLPQLSRLKNYPSSNDLHCCVKKQVACTHGNNFGSPFCSDMLVSLPWVQPWVLSYGTSQVCTAVPPTLSFLFKTLKKQF